MIRAALWKPTPLRAHERMSDLPGLLVIMSCSGVISSIEWAQPK